MPASIERLLPARGAEAPAIARLQAREAISGTGVLRDFVELPSQLYEHWLDRPEILERFARHYKTGEPMPRALMDRLIASRTFNQGFLTTDLLDFARDRPPALAPCPLAELVADAISVVPAPKHVGVMRQHGEGGRGCGEDHGWLATR